MAKRAHKKTLKDKLEGVRQTLENQKSNFVAGVHGEYFIGASENLHYFNIESVVIPGNDFRQEYTLKKITGDISAAPGLPAVHIPFSWLFKEESTCNFASGNTGTIQAEMLTFLKDSLKEVIAAAKEGYVQTQAPELPQSDICKTEEELDIIAQNKANTLAEQASIRPHDLIFKIATVSGVAVGNRPDEYDLRNVSNKKTRSLKDLIPGAFGRYDFGDKDRHCIVDYSIIEPERTLFRIITLHKNHPLSQAGVRQGDSLLGYYLSHERSIPSPKEEILEEARLYAVRVTIKNFFLKKIEEASCSDQQVDTSKVA